MNGPPNNVEPSELWLKLSSSERPHKVVEFPRQGPDGNPVAEMAIRVLSQEEKMACDVAAEAFCKKHLKEYKKDELGYEAVYGDAYVVELLFRMCRDVNDVGRPAFPSPLHVRELSTEECAVLFRQCLIVQKELGPIVDYLSDEDLEAWIDRLYEAGSAYPFASLSSEQQSLLLMHMVYRLRPSPTDSISAGEQLTNYSTTNDEGSKSEPPPAPEE